MKKRRNDYTDLTLEGVQQRLNQDTERHRRRKKKWPGAASKYWETMVDGLSPSPIEHLNSDEYCATRLKIKNKYSKVIYFVQNKAQHDFSTKRTGRDIILKPRQIGFSTKFQAEIMELLQRKRGINATTIADSSESTTTLVEIFDRFYENLPEPEKPFRRGRYPHGIKFPDRDSLVYLGTAGSKHWGRGKTIHYVHASEVAFWPDARGIMDGLMESVPPDPNRQYTTVVIESTPNGAGGYFYEEVQKALRGDSQYRVHFYTWWWAEEYQTPLKKHEKIKLTTQEEELIRRVYKQEKLKLSPAQINWRRQKIEEKGEVFWQEYPEDIITCFLTSGRPRFNQKRLHERINTQCHAPIFEDLPIMDQGNLYYQVRIYEKPISNHQYVIGADPSEGIMVSSSGETDYSAAIIRNARTNTQVASIQGRIEPFEFAYILAKLAIYYNNALLAVERNNHGHAVIGHLVHGSSDGQLKPYGNLYIHYDDKKFGWPTNSRTRPTMISDLALEYRYPNSYVIRDEAIINEAVTFIVNNNGRAEASMGTHDDLVMADAIAGQIRTAPFEATETRYEPVQIGDF